MKRLAMFFQQLGVFSAYLEIRNNLLNIKEKLKKVGFKNTKD